MSGRESSFGAILFGGRHEAGRRAGTENTPVSSRWARQPSLPAADLAAEMTRLAALRDRLEQGILDRVPDVSVNGAARCGPEYDESVL